MSTHLLVIFFGYLASAALMIGTALFVLWKDPHRRLNISFFFLTIPPALWAIDFAIATSIEDPHLAYVAWMFNLVNVFITMGTVRFYFDLTDLQDKFRWYIRLTYALGLGILAIGVLFPHLFLPYVEPKMYFPTYLVPGPWYVVMVVYFFLMPALPLIELVRASLRASGLERNRLQYFIVMTLIAFGFACLDFLLVFDIPVDPVFGSFFGLYLIPFAYAVISDQMFDIRVFLERTFVYIIGAVFAGVFLVAFFFFNNLLMSVMPGSQYFTIPIAVGLVVVIVIYFVVRQIRETSRLKYEFITVAAHKLRTPLTTIRWQTSALLDTVTDPALKESIERISNAGRQLIELSTLLLDAAKEKEEDYRSERVPVDLGESLQHVLLQLHDAITYKKMIVTTAIDEKAKRVIGDPRRIESVIEVFINNAVTYTPEGGTITISTERKGRKILFQVKDTGFGVSVEDREHVFSSFFRSAQAKLADTEGVGLGLAMSKSIITSQHGSIGMFSDGEGKGSTFWFSLPAA